MTNAATLEKAETKKATQRIYRAPVAMYENESTFTVLLAIPGADEKAISVSVEDGRLEINAPFKMHLAPASVQKYSEIQIGNYARSLDLGDKVDEETIEATFRAGLLQVTMQKSQKGHAKKITVKAQ